MDQDTCKKIVELFEAVRARPVMYTGKSYDYARTIQLITGFRLAMEVTGEIESNIDDLKKELAEMKSRLDRITEPKR